MKSMLSRIDSRDQSLPVIKAGAQRVMLVKWHPEHTLNIAWHKDTLWVGD